MLVKIVYVDDKNSGRSQLYYGSYHIHNRLSLDRSFIATMKIMLLANGLYSCKIMVTPKFPTIKQSIYELQNQRLLLYVVGLNAPETPSLYKK